MATDWRLSEAQQQAVTLRAALAAAEQVVARYEIDFRIATAHEEEFKQQRDRIRARMAELGPAIGMDGQPRRYQTAEEIDEYRRLGREISDLEASRARWLDAHGIRWTDAVGRQQSYVLVPISAELALQAARRRRDAAASALAEVEGRLSPGQLVQTGVEAPDFRAHRERVEARASRLG